MGDFGKNAEAALASAKLRGNLRRAMDGLMAKRGAQFADADEWSRLRALGTNVRRRSLARLPELLRKLEETCTANAIQVHWAETPAEANQVVLDILRRNGAETVVKGKSMVSEEMHLNGYLEENGVEILETDLGEYVIQLAGETPSHIIMPCIHKNRDEIAKLFEDKIEGAAYTEDPAELTEIARKALRRRFAEAGAGVTGVNFAVAETGTLCLVENEGNGRMSTTLPPVHIAVMGIEKVVESLEDVAPLLSLLTRSATGQGITTYVNMISSPRRADDRDGPREVHLILLDNGRSSIHADADLRPTLQCIRCGACMNHCPVYSRVGGHAYSSVYPGPIGKILMPQISGFACYGDLPGASSLCGACVDVCPVKVPITDILVQLRARLEKTKGLSLGSVAWTGWKIMHASPGLYRLVTRVLGLVGGLIPRCAPLLRAWTRVRAKPRFAPKSLHRLAREGGFDHE